MEALSIIGIIISVLGVILSLLLFNASINNGRKLLINELLYLLNREILQIFSIHRNDKKIIKNKDIINKNLMKLVEIIDKIKFDYWNYIPAIGSNLTYNKNNTVTHFYNINEFYNELDIYLKRKNIYYLKLMIELYDDRLYILQHYHDKLKYIRKFFIGPIIGVKKIYVRKRRYANYSGKKVKLLRKIKNIKTMEMYYNKCYTKFNIFQLSSIKKEKFNRTINDINFKTEKGKEQLPIIYV